MTTRIPLSATSQRTTSPAISSLMSLALANPELISLAAGFVDQASLPVAEVAEAFAAVNAERGEGGRALQYGTTIGDVRLRERVLSLIEESEGVAAGTYEPLLARTVITTGSQQLLYLVAEALIDPGDIVLVESPTYFVFLGVLETRGARVIGIETDDHGLKVDALEETLAGLKAQGLLDRVKLIYTVSEHSNPTGISLAPGRRPLLVAVAKRWSERHLIYILEDSAYRGLTFEGSEPPSVWRHDEDGETVILARTFSKTFSPGLKTGYSVLPRSLVEPVLRIKGNHDFGSANFNQVVLERLIAVGAYRRHLAGLIELYRRKCDTMLKALEEQMGSFEGVTWTRPEGGLYVWLTVPEGLDTGLDGRLFSRSLNGGVLFVPGSYAFAADPGPPPRNHARLCFGVPSEAELVEGVRRLAAALAGCFDLDPVA